MNGSSNQDTPSNNAPVITGLNINAIVVNFNGIDSLQDCVAALLQSSISIQDSLHIYVVDNCSTDNSLSALNAYLEENHKPSCAKSALPNPALEQWHYQHNQVHITLIQNSSNSGFAAANNLILDNMTGDFFILVNPDCIVSNNAITDLVTIMHADKNIGMASGIIRNDDGSIQATSKRRFPTPSAALARMIGLTKILSEATLIKKGWQDFNYGHADYSEPVESVEALSGAFLAVSGESLQKVGSLDTAYFMHCEDLDWCMRYQQAGYKVVSCQNVEVTHIKEVSSATRPIRVIVYMHRGMIIFFEKFYKDKYPWWQRYLVYLGIMARLLIKVSFTWLKTVVFRLKSRNGS